MTIADPTAIPAEPAESRGDWILPDSHPNPDRQRVPVTVIIPTLNEAKNLPRCLEAVAWADEVVVVDSNSKDGTQQIANAYGAKVLNFTWNNQWPKKRNWVLRHAALKHEWVLIVDADEVAVPDLEAEVAEIVRSETSKVGYYINRRFIFLGRWIRHCGYYPSWNLRLLKRGHGEYEQLTTGGETGSGDKRGARARAARWRGRSPQVRPASLCVSRHQYLRRETQSLQAIGRRLCSSGRPLPTTS